MPFSHISVFDLDGTLIKGNSSFKFCFYLVKKGVMPRLALGVALWNYLWHKCGKRSLGTLHEKIFSKLLKGLTLDLLEQHIEPFICEVLSHSCYLPALERLRSAQHLGHFTLILSNAPSFLVKKIADYFQVDDWRCTEYDVDEHNRLSAIAFIMEGTDKAESIRDLAQKSNIQISNITAYSDSYLDLPLFQAVGEPIAVNPDKKLKKICKRCNWVTI